MYVLAITSDDSKTPINPLNTVHVAKCSSIFRTTAYSKTGKHF